MGSMKEIFNSLLLKELLKGMSVTGKYFFARKITVQYPEEKHRRACPFPRPPRVAPLPERGGALHRLQTVRGHLSGHGITIEAEPRDDGSRRTTRYDIDLTKCIFCGFCEEACPVDAVVETRIFEYHGEKRGDLYYTKPMLLANGDRYEAQIAADREMDAQYR